MCNCKLTEIIVALVILVASFITTIPYANWIIIIAAVVLLIHGLGCKNIASCCEEIKPKAKRKR